MQHPWREVSSCKNSWLPAWGLQDELLLCPWGLLSTAATCCSQLRAEKSSSQPWFWVAEAERRAGPRLACWSNRGDATQLKKGFVSLFLAACKPLAWDALRRVMHFAVCGVGLLRCRVGPFQARWFERLCFLSWNVSLAGVYPLLPLTPSSLLGWGFWCVNIFAGCLRKLKCQIDLLRFFFSWGRRFLYNSCHESIQRDAFFCTS